MSFSIAEENYLKAIYQLSRHTNDLVSTSDIADTLETAAASVTDMIKKLAEKSLISYERYRGVRLTESGKIHANLIVRKHRLWETFLHDKLNFDWDEVHDIAEQLEHIQAPKLVDRLDEFLGFPKFDPHGDPIPDKNGRFTLVTRHLLHDIEIGQWVKIVGVADHDRKLLQHLNRLDISMHMTFKIIERFDYDGSIEIELENGSSCNLSHNVQNNLFVQYVKS